MNTQNREAVLGVPGVGQATPCPVLLQLPQTRPLASGTGKPARPYVQGQVCGTRVLSPGHSKRLAPYPAETYHAPMVLLVRLWGACAMGGEHCVVHAHTCTATHARTPMHAHARMHPAGPNVRPRRRRTTERLSSLQEAITRTGYMWVILTGVARHLARDVVLELVVIVSRSGLFMSGHHMNCTRV